jgi:hypothetical protein
VGNSHSHQLYLVGTDQEKKVSKAIVTAQVEDSANWENDFRSHVGLFRTYTATAINFSATDDNEVAILWEVANLDKFLEQLDSPETAEAMAQDGVNRESVKVYVLDKEINL